MARQKAVSKPGTHKPANPTLRMSEVPPLDLDAMTFEERRVAIAKDVLALLSARRLEPTHGTYINPFHFADDGVDDLSPEELRKLLDTPPRKCEVCALGASLVSFVRIFDQLSGDDFNDRVGLNRVRSALGEAYSWMVEGAFERYGVDLDGGRWLVIEGEWVDPRPRLRVIMKTVVETAGDFDAFRDRYFEKKAPWEA
jgi:hypothetical protein